MVWKTDWKSSQKCVLHFEAGEIRASKRLPSTNAPAYILCMYIQCTTLHGFASKLCELNTMKYLSLVDRVRECFSLIQRWNAVYFVFRLYSVRCTHQHSHPRAHLMNLNAVDFALILIESLPHSVRSVFSSYCYFNYNYSGTSSDRIAMQGKCNFHWKIDFHSFALMLFSLPLH